MNQRDKKQPRKTEGEIQNYAKFIGSSRLNTSLDDENRFLSSAPTDLISEDHPIKVPIEKRPSSIWKDVKSFFTAHWVESVAMTLVVFLCGTSWYVTSELRVLNFVVASMEKKIDKFENEGQNSINNLELYIERKLETINGIIRDLEKDVAVIKFVQEHEKPSRISKQTK